MITVVGHWELSWNTPIKEVELWNMQLRDWGVDRWLMWPVTGIVNNEQQFVPLTEYPDVQSALDDLTPCSRVFLEPSIEGSTMLPEFQHPEDVVYIFGSAHFNPVIANCREQDDVVTIPTAANAGLLWPHQALSVVMYDRLTKQWQ